MTWTDYIDEAKQAYDSNQLTGYGDSAKSLMNSLAISEYNAAEAEKAWQRQVDMIREQNEYNSPVQQMERYREAGLNPLLMYGQISPGQQSAIAEYQANRVDPSSGKVTKGQEIFGRTMQALSMIADFAKLGTSINNSVLETQMMNEQLKSMRYSNYKAGMENDMIRSAWETLPENGLDVRSADFLQSVFMPALAKQDATYGHISYEQSRKAWQDWYNENILPLQKQQMETRAGMLDYNLGALESMPEWLRPWAQLLMNAFNIYSKF